MRFAFWYASMRSFDNTFSTGLNGTARRTPNCSHTSKKSLPNIILLLIHPPFITKHRATHINNPPWKTHITSVSLASLARKCVDIVRRVHLRLESFASTTNPFLRTTPEDINPPPPPNRSRYFAYVFKLLTTSTPPISTRMGSHLGSKIHLTTNTLSPPEVNNKSPIGNDDDAEAMEIIYSGRARHFMM